MRATIKLKGLQTLENKKKTFLLEFASAQLFLTLNKSGLMECVFVQSCIKLTTFTYAQIND